MKHGKKPTRRQKMLLKSNGLNHDNWLVCKDMPTEMVVEHRHTGHRKRINKNI